MKSLNILVLVLLSTSVYAKKCKVKEKYYKSCSDQEKLLRQAMHQSSMKKKPTLVVLGFNTCPWCITLDTAFKKEKALKKFKKKLNMVKIDGTTDSGKKVIETLKSLSGNKDYKRSFPTLAVLSPDGRKAKLVPLLEDIEVNTKDKKAHNYQKVSQLIENMVKSVR